MTVFIAAIISIITLVVAGVVFLSLPLGIGIFIWWCVCKVRGEDFFDEMCSTYLNPGVAAWGLGATIICCSSLVFTAGYIILSVIASFFYMPELKQDSTDIVELSYHHQQEISNQAGKDGFDLLTKKYGVR